MAAHCACRLLVNAMAIVSMTQATRLITARERLLPEQCVTGTWGHVFSQFHFHLELVTLISLIDKWSEEFLELSLIIKYLFAFGVQ